MKKLRPTASIVPNLFTSMNMFCGFLSIINASQGRFIYSAWLIIIAAIFDSLDGMIARLTNSTSELGVELDSLSDVVSFGAAPAFLIYSTELAKFNVVGIIISSLLMIAGGFRLARFNVQLIGFDKTFFKGLPIPTSAMTIATFVITFYIRGIGFSESEAGTIIPLVIILSYLMVSRIKYDTMPKFSLDAIKNQPFIILFIVAGIAVLIITSGRALFYIFVLYILFGIFRHIFYLITKKN
jgi:CDP-diacylglycerol---serine O-phosphatidyltransferase